MEKIKRKKVLKIVEAMKDIEKLSDKINKLQKKINRIETYITTTIWKGLKDWKPSKDEMAVCFSPDRENAWFVWFIEKRGDFYRFKETPSWEPRIRMYYRQNIEPEEGGDFIIMPTNMFHQLNVELKMGILNKYEEISAHQ